MLAAALDGPIVVSKGPCDVISDGSSVARCSMPNSLRRAGGQGDVLAGGGERGGWGGRGGQRGQHDGGHFC